MATLDDLYNTRTIVSDGEALDPSDITDMQLLQSRMLSDLVMASGVLDLLDDPASTGTVQDLESARLVITGSGANLAPPSDVVFAPQPGSAFVMPGASANELLVMPGPIATFNEDLSAAANPGHECALLLSSLGPYYVPTSLTTAVGDATHPRLDLVQVAVTYADADPQSRDFEDATTRVVTTQTFNKRRSTRTTLSIKQGTPATLPTYPAPDTGCKALAAVWVAAGHNAVHDPLDIRDLRWPLGLKVYDVPANQAWLPGSTPWTLAAGAPNFVGAIEGPSSGTGSAYFMCPVGSKSARLVGIGVHGQGGSGSQDVSLVRVQQNMPSPPLVFTLADFGASLLPITPAFTSATALQMMDLLANSADARSKGTRATNTRTGTPVWCGGWPCGVAQTRSGPLNGIAQIGVRITEASSTALVSFVRFYVAEGMW